MDPVLRSQMVKFTKVFVIAAIIFYTAFELSGISSEVGTLYFRYAEAMVDLKMPYSGFDAEYPPFAMLLILIPRLFSFSPLTYQIAFGVEVYVFLLAGLVCVHRLAAGYTERPKRVSDLYIVLSICLFDFVLDRYDIFPTIMCLMALYFVKTERINLAWAMIALGTVTKLYPALIAPLLLTYLFMNGRRNDAMRGVGICLVIGCLSMLPFLIAGPDTMLMFLTYHMERGMQTEAVISPLLMLLGDLGLMDITYIFNFGSDNILGPVPDAIAGYVLYIMVASIVAVYVAYGVMLSRRRDADMFPLFVFACFVTVLTFMLVSKVLSSQYLVWIIPFVAMATVLLEGRRRKDILYLFGGAILLTQINLVVNYAFRDAGDPFSTLGITVLLVRNVLMVMIYVLTIVAFLKGTSRVRSDGTAG